ncbi:unnamed protein product [Peronospora farinosa]|uniref:Transposase-associated domain-containing protein n=1 Tax=Peronospora farinosa TaxID=134698 RepID=A0ABN8CEL5_9STRA|nr:unnamed protein product [Peronospora farinosa]
MDRNWMGYRDMDQIKDHLIRRGFKSNYTRWTWHGEFYDVGMSSTSLCDDLHVDEVEVEIEGDGDNENDRVDDENDMVDDENDRVDEMLHNLEDERTDRPHMYDSILSAAEKPMYPGCKNFTKLSGILTLFNMKSKHSWMR